MTTINVKKEMGARIRALRKRKGLTQEDMASRCGLHWTYIGGLERGERNPTLTTLHRVAGGLSVPIGDLINTPSFKKAPTTDDAKEGKLLRLLRRKDPQSVDLAAGLVREVLRWRARYAVRSK